MAFITLRQANVVNSPDATIKGSPLSNSEVDNNFANLNLGISDLSNVVTNLSSSEISNGTSNIKITVASGPISVTGNIIPTSDNVFSLGNANFVFSDLFLSGNSLHLGSLVLSEVNGNIALGGVEVLSATEGAVPADGSITNVKIENGAVTSEKLSNTGVSAGIYGSSITVARIDVGSDGRIIEASNISIVSGAILQDVTNVDLDSFFPVMANNQTSGNFEDATVSSTKLFFNTQTGVLNATDFNSLSDATLKTNLQPIVDASSMLKMISGIEFNWKDNNRKSAGVLAQELETVLPHTVTQSSSGLKSVNYGSLTAYLIQSIKELITRIEELEKKNGS